MSRLCCFALTLSWLFAVVPVLLGDEAVPADPAPRWWKGNIHTHSLWSDGDDFPEMIAEWYRTHGYHFLALSDHNILSDGMRWMKHDDIVKRGGKDALAKYQARFGGGWVETRGQVGTAEFEVRLKPLNEFRALLEERGSFIMIPGEEISDRALGKPIHLNATNIKEKIAPLGGANAREAITNNLRAVNEQAARAGREILLHVNHPNFGYAITAEDLAAVVEERFFEVFNGHPIINHLGDENHPGVERLWDIANTIRLGELGAAALYGVATDDSHDYHGQPGSHVGRGWIMVRSKYLTPEHLIRAIKAGQFYASSGVLLSDISFDQQARELNLSIDAQPGASYTISFIGTRAGYDKSSQPRTSRDGKPLAVTRKYSSDVGSVLSQVVGRTAKYRLTGDELYVRAVVTSSQPHPDPSYQNQYQQAWTQPVGWEKNIE